MPPMRILPAKSDADVRLGVPGDKSISHRAVLFNAIAQGGATVHDAGLGQDVLSSIRCMRHLGIHFEVADRLIRIHGQGMRGLTASAAALDCGNSGTTARLISGILAGQPFRSVLEGDQSLSRRPMRRIAEPLRLMGAQVLGDTLPLTIQGGSLRGIEYQPDVASAQVKSCILLAALFATSPTTLIEPLATRDHTERLLQAQGVQVDLDLPRITVHPPSELHAVDIQVPGDFSSAAYWLVAALVSPGASVHVSNVGINPARIGLLEVLREMGAQIEILNPRTVGGEPVADLLARHSELRGASIGGAMIPRLVDEVPILSVAAAVANGTTTITDAAELRVKESDRLAAVAAGLTRLGVQVQELPEGLIIHGDASLDGGETLETYGDHRLAMSWAVAGLAAKKPVTIDDAECVSISYPSFWADLERFNGQ